MLYLMFVRLTGWMMYRSNIELRNLS